MSESDSNSNPFSDLRPALRSEEDDIRKGIFSTALRNLSKCSLEERIRWCTAIREATAPKRPCAASPHVKKAAKRLRTEEPEAEVTTAATTSSGSTVFASPASSMHDDVPPTVSSRGSIEKGEGTDEVANPESFFTMEEAGECVAAYMRGLLDRVVGSSLDNLPAAALKVLCMMLNIETPSRNKTALYNILASHYYTHCEKLGKRVSKSTIYDKQVKQDAELLNALPHHKSSPSSAFPSASTPALQQRFASLTKATSSAASAASAAVKPTPKAALAKQQPQGKKTAASTVAPGYGGLGDSDEGEWSEDIPDDAERQGEVELVVDCPRGVFVAPTRIPAAAPSYQQRSVAEGSGWTQAELERKIASIVQMFDPVTAATVVKKLSLVGYREDNVSAVVESVLRDFHQRQLIYYDNGIAYLM